MRLYDQNLEEGFVYSYMVTTEVQEMEHTPVTGKSMALMDTGANVHIMNEELRTVMEPELYRYANPRKIYTAK